MTRATAAEKRHMDAVAALQCIICRRFENLGLSVELHHIAESSSLRSNWLVAPLCGNQVDGGHHRGATGLHGPNGTRWFIRFYKVPHDSEYGLLAWVNEDLEAMRSGKYRTREAA